MPESIVEQGEGAHALDTLIWNALSTRQAEFAVPGERVLRFQPEVAPFAALADLTPESFGALRESIERYGPAALVTVDEIEPPEGFDVLRRATLIQMVAEREPEPVALEHVRLEPGDVPDMLALTAATQPGPFGPRTIELGRYLGVRRQGRLAAMAGERLRIDGYAEISAVCVDPAFRGQGLAAGLMRLLMAAMRARGEIPFLHAVASNQNAIAIYRAMGFVARRELHLLVLGDAGA
ncbi:GNAT family N-acetyltransferase [Burkholderia gladioli]|uniref:GNAT family N-acetyltransferase n=1 Tax=Burkholderia gladioli TaxID=28095 RepID=UPI00163ECF26|nr:GNAT family N-acetyltransferase [Burkholderia gladioli]